MAIKSQIRLFEHDLLSDYRVDANQVIRQCCLIRDQCKMISDDLLDYPDIDFVEVFNSVLQYVEDCVVWFADMISGKKEFNIQHYIKVFNSFKKWFHRLSDLARHTLKTIMLVETGFTFYVLEQNCEVLGLMIDSVIRQYLDKYPDTDIFGFPYDWSNIPFPDSLLPPVVPVDFDSYLT